MSQSEASPVKTSSETRRPLSGDEFVPGKDVLEANPDLTPFPPLHEGLAGNWPPNGRTDIYFDNLTDHLSCARPEARRLQALWRSSSRSCNYISREYEQGPSDEGVYYIPARFKSDRVFLINPGHAMYVELAYLYLNGDVPDPPLRQYRSAWRVPSCLVDHEFRHQNQDTRQACRVFGVFMANFEYSLYVGGHNGRPRFQDGCFMRTETQSFPKVPQRLLDAWPCDALFQCAPLIALYFGQTYFDFGEDGIERYHKALDEEFAVLAALAIYDEAVGNNKVWQISHETYTFLSKTLSTEGLPPLDRLNREPLSWDTVTEKINVCRQLRPEQVSPFRIGPVICMWARWNESTGQVTKPGRRTIKRGAMDVADQGSVNEGQAWTSAVFNEPATRKSTPVVTKEVVSEVPAERRPLTPRPATPAQVDPMDTVLRGCDLASLPGFEVFFKDAKLAGSSTYTVRQLLPILQIRFNSEFAEAERHHQRSVELQEECNKASENWRHYHDQCQKHDDETAALKAEKDKLQTQLADSKALLADYSGRLKEAHHSRELHKQHIGHLEADCRRYRDLLQSSMALVSAYRTQAPSVGGSEVTAPAPILPQPVANEPVGSSTAAVASPKVSTGPQTPKKAKTMPMEIEPSPKRNAKTKPVTRSRTKKAAVSKNVKPKSGEGGSSSDLEFIGPVTPVKTKPKLRSVKPEPKELKVTVKLPISARDDVQPKQSEGDGASDRGESSDKNMSVDKGEASEETKSVMKSEPVSLPVVRNLPEDIPSSPPRRQRRRRC